MIWVLKVKKPGPAVAFPCPRPRVQSSMDPLYDSVDSPKPVRRKKRIVCMADRRMQACSRGIPQL